MPSSLVRWHLVKFQLTDPNVCGECLRMWWKCNYAVLGCLMCAHQQQQRQQWLKESLRSCKKWLLWTPRRSLLQAIEEKHMTRRLKPSRPHVRHCCHEAAKSQYKMEAKWHNGKLTTQCQTMKFQWYTCVSKCFQLSSITVLWPTFGTLKLSFMTYIYMVGTARIYVNCCHLNKSITPQGSALFDTCNYIKMFRLCSFLVVIVGHFRSTSAGLPRNHCEMRPSWYQTSRLACLRCHSIGVAFCQSQVQHGAGRLGKYRGTATGVESAALAASGIILPCLFQKFNKTAGECRTAS